MTGSNLCNNQISLVALWRLSKMGWGGVRVGMDAERPGVHRKPSGNNGVGQVDGSRGEQAIPKDTEKDVQKTKRPGPYSQKPYFS